MRNKLLLNSVMDLKEPRASDCVCSLRSLGFQALSQRLRLVQLFGGLLEDVLQVRLLLAEDRLQ